jgi:carbonic anhydrase/acetyltransferase-like protein (isoleucine patch superfamily)
MPNGFRVVQKGQCTVELGAVVVVPGGRDLGAIQGTQFCARQASENSRPLYSSRLPILGNDVLQSWIERVRKLGLQNLWLISPTDENAIWSRLRGFAQQGVERLLMITLKSYAEMDLADLLRFHHETRNPVTEALDAQGQLGVRLLDHRAFHGTCENNESFRVPDNGGRTPYQFRGYAKRILSAKERQELVGDALTGACAMRPFGKQIREQVWIGEGAQLADSVRVIGPTYIGARTVVRAGATIGPFASVEHDCVVDCGTIVERSTVLPYTYLAPGLLIRHGLVDGGRLEDLSWETVVDLQPTGLGSRIRRGESRRKTFRENDNSSRTGGAFVWGSRPSSGAPQPWMQVQL